ncbi:M48 family metallopeptidase [Yoonia sp. MH D7]
MDEVIEISGISIHLTRKAVKNVHLSVHPPHGRVTLVAPTQTRLDVARAYAITKLGWIRDQQEKLCSQPRVSSRQFVGRETHFLWGRRYLMTVSERDEKPSIKIDHRTIRLGVRPNTSTEKKAQIVHDWHKRLMHAVIPDVLTVWETKLGVSASDYFLQRMKTKWGSCNPKTKTIRLNTELVKKPKDLLEYVIVHELMHLHEPTHSPRFFDLMNQYYPSWTEARRELNDLPLSDEAWGSIYLNADHC